MKKCLFFFLVVLALASCNKEQNLYRIQENGLYGFIDSLGNVVIEPQYKYVGYFSKDGYACVISDIRIEKADGDSLLKGFVNAIDSCIQVTYGYINRKNELVIDTTNHICIPFVSLHYWGGHSLVEIAQNLISGRFGFRSELLNELALCDSLFVFQDEQSKLFGYKDYKGKIKIEAKYDYCHSFRNGLAVVNINKKTEEISDAGITDRVNSTAVIDTNGNLIASEFTAVNDYGKNGLTWAMSTAISLEEQRIDRDWVQIDKSGKIVSGPISSVAWIYNNNDYPICVIDMGVFGTYYTFLDINGAFLSDFDHNKELSLGWRENEKPELFADVTRFSSGVAGIKGYNAQGESAWYFVKNNLTQVSEPYDSLLPFSDGLAAVKELTHSDVFSTHVGKWGFVKMEMPDSVISQSIPFSFSECGSFIDGLAYFKNEGSTFDLEGYINKQGKIVWQTKRKNNK